MVSPLSYSFISSRLSSLNFSMLGMLMTLQWLGLGHTFPIIFTISNSWATTKSVLVVSPSHQLAAQAFFSHLGVKVCTGHRYL